MLCMAKSLHTRYSAIYIVIMFCTLQQQQDKNMDMCASGAIYWFYS